MVFAFIYSFLLSSKKRNKGSYETNPIVLCCGTARGLFRTKEIITIEQWRRTVYYSLVTLRFSIFAPALWQRESRQRVEGQVMFSLKWPQFEMITLFVVFLLVFKFFLISQVFSRYLFAFSKRFKRSQRGSWPQELKCSMNHRENRGTQRKRGGKFIGHQRHIIEISGNPPAVYVETPSTWLASLVVLALMVVAIVPICTSS